MLVVPGGSVRRRGARGRGAQVWDLLEPVLEKVEWALPRRRCVWCRKVTTAAVPGVRHAAAGGVSYGPRLHGAAVLLASEANVSVERAAMVIDALLGVPVSAGFVARANERLAHDLQAAGAAQQPRRPREPPRAEDQPTRQPNRRRPLGPHRAARADPRHDPVLRRHTGAAETAAVRRPGGAAS